MSHRREAGAIPPWVIPEEHKRSFRKNEIHPIPLNIDHELKEINSSDHTTSNGSTISTSLLPKKEQLYITGGQLVNSDHIQFANILIEDGKIVSNGTNIEVQPDTPTLDATGMLIMPGGIDMSTYLIQDIHSIDTEAYINYTKEALLGGTTTIVDTIVCPKGSSALDLLIKYKNTFKEKKFWCDIIIRIGFIGGIQENQINEIEQLTKQYGINSFLFIIDPMEMDKTSKDSLYITNLLKALDKCKQTGSIAVIKFDLRKTINDCSNNYLNKQNDLELRSVEKCIFLATSINCPIIFTSINDMNIIEKISEAKRQIPPIHITVCCTSNSLLSEIPHNQFGNGLLPLLTNGDIKLISSDYSDVDADGKSNSLQTIRQRLITTWKAGVPTGWLDASTFVSITSSNASHYLGLYPTKGCLHSGSDADLICWSYENITDCTIQYPSIVIHHGKLVVYNGNLIKETTNDLMINPCNKLNECQSNQPQGSLQIGKLFPSTIYDQVNGFERLRKINQILIVREPWTMNNLNEELATISKISNNLENNNNQNSEQTKVCSSNENLMTMSTNIRTIRGNRDLHASGFSLSGAQVDDDRPIRSTIRTQQQSETRNPLW
ncbi:unnamed protein product [Schistosoma rodhaini]|uniref:dihydropyrimidinase n=1 Tax=Schistosoma rodhaini TaxID=6188 RepID=A0AA85FNM2_9TREM|nr:unnamed protein product [Schistosoma rodhaini]